MPRAVGVIGKSNCHASTVGGGQKKSALRKKRNRIARKAADVAEARRRGTTVLALHGERARQRAEIIANKQAADEAAWRRAQESRRSYGGWSSY